MLDMDLRQFEDTKDVIRTRKSKTMPWANASFA